MPTTMANNLQSPTDMPLVNPMNGSVASMRSQNASDEGNGKVKMKKQLGLIEGVAIILGIIFGSGEFKVKKCFKTRTLIEILRICSFLRYFCITKGCHSRSECGRNVVSNLGNMRFFVNGWSSMLCGIRNINTAIGW